MRSKHILRILVAVLVVCLSVTLIVGCANNGNGELQQGGENSENVSSAVFAVYQSIQNNRTITGADVIYVGFNGSIEEETNGELSPATLFSFDAKIHVGDDEEGVGKSTLAFKVKKDTTNVSLLEAYWKGGDLYVNYAPVFPRVAISGFDLEGITKKLVQSSNSTSGKWRTTVDLLPTFAEHVLSECTKRIDGNKRTYKFKVDYSKIAGALDVVLSSADIGVTRQNVLDIFGVTAQSLNEIEQSSSSSLEIITLVSGGVETFESATLTRSDETTVKKVSLNSFRADAVTEDNQNDYPVNLAENLDTYKPFDFKNLSLSGVASLNLSSVNSSATVLNDRLDLSTQMATFEYLYDFLSVNDESGFKASLKITDEDDAEKSFSAYYDGDLYVDASAVVKENPFVKVEREFIESALKAVNVLVDSRDLESKETLYLLANLLASRKENKGFVSYTVSKDMLDLVFEKAGYDPVFDYTAIKLDLNLEAGTFKGMDVSFLMKGASVKLSANYPKVGHSVTFTTPEWIENCVDLTSQNIVAPIVSGELNTNIPNVTNTQLVESLIYSMSGENVELNGNVKNFKISANYNAKGKLSVYEIEFSEAGGSTVCTLYYNYSEPDAFYVIMPAENGVSKVSTLKMLSESKFGEFAHTINGNVAVDQNPAAFTLSNTQKGFIVEANSEALNALLRKVKSVFADSRNLTVPLELGLDKIVLTLQDGAAVRSWYGNNRYIELKVNDVSLKFDDLTVATRQINSHGDQSVSIYQNNDMPETVKITLGKGSLARSLTVAVEDFGGWQYEDLPEFADTVGEQEIVAFVKVFGQKINDVIKVDYTKSENVEISYNRNGPDFETVYDGEDRNELYRSYLKVEDGKQAFVFPRYNSEVDPIGLIVNKYNLAIVANVQKDVTWINRNVELNENSFTNQGDDEQEAFTLNPVITDFFGNKVKLNVTYRLKLEGARVRDIKNGDDFLTIYAYSGQDPLSPSTYLAAHTEFNLISEESEPQTIVINDLEWDISSIKYKNMEGATASTIVEMLRNNLYKLNGQYTISVKFKTSLRTEVKKEATVTVKPRVVEKIVLNDLIDGVVEFIPNDGRKDGEAYGLIILDPIVIGFIRSENAFAKSITCNFTDATAESSTINTIKWQTPDLNNVKISGDSAISGTISAIIGNAVGGLQSIDIDYVFLNYPVTKVALTSDGKVVSEKDYQNSLSFELLSQNPYGFVFPEDVTLVYDAFAVTYRGADVRSYPAGSKVIEGVEWNLDGFDFNTIWQNDASVEYSGGVKITDITLSLKLSFLNKILEKDVWAFIDENGDEYLDPSLPVATPQTYVEDENGSYYFVNGLYVYSSEALEETAYSKVDGVTSSVYYKKPNDKDVKRLIIDPTTTDYLCFESYPSRVRVTFQDGQTQDLDAIWDISQLAQTTDVSQRGYFGSVSLYIAGRQKVADVSMWIAAEKPDRYYISPAFIGDELDVANSGNHLYLSIFDVDYQGKLVVKDIRNLKAIHDLTCDCDEEGCLGRIYFDYSDKNVESGYFKITEWQGLEQISQLYEREISNGVAVEDIHGDVTLIAKVDDTECIVTLTIEQAVMSNMQISGLPYPSSTMYGGSMGGYSMKATGLDLTIDPYLASPTDGSQYPTTIDFSHKGESVQAKISYWDCSAFENVDLFNGASEVVYAYIATPYEVDLRIAVNVKLLSRNIERVYVDGQDVKRIYVEPYSAKAFGSNVEIENGRYYAYKAVDVKFVGDDDVYPMSLKYDITDYEMNYRGGLIAQNETVYVGSEAGGYQAVGGYSIYNVQNTLLALTCEDDKLAGINGGVVYTETVDGRSFYSFGDSAEDNAAWEALTVLAGSLKVEVGYYVDELGNKVSQTLTAREYVSGREGLVYSWTRQNVNGKNYLFFNLWYESSDLGDKTGPVQSICTYNEKYVALTGEPFSLASLENADVTYSQGLTLKTLFANYPIISTNSFTFEDLIIVVTDADGKTYAMDDQLVAGDYSVEISVDNDRYIGSVNTSFKIKPIAIGNLTITLNNRTQSKAVMESKTIRSVYGNAINMFAVCDEGVEIEVTYWKGEEQVAPVAVGEYTVKFTPVDKNYYNSLGDFTLVIESVED